MVAHPSSLAISDIVSSTYTTKFAPGLTEPSWTFTILWVIGGALESFSIQSCMLLFMKAVGRYSVPQNNTYPLGITAIGRALSNHIVITLMLRYRVYFGHGHFNRCDWAAPSMGSRRLWPSGRVVYLAPRLESPDLGQACSVL